MPPALDEVVQRCRFHGLQVVDEVEQAEIGADPGIGEGDRWVEAAGARRAGVEADQRMARRMPGFTNSK